MPKMALTDMAAAVTIAAHEILNQQLVVVCSKIVAVLTPHTSILAVEQKRKNKQHMFLLFCRPCVFLGSFHSLLEGGEAAPTNKNPIECLLEGWGEAARGRGRGGRGSTMREGG